MICFALAAELAVALVTFVLCCWLGFWRFPGDDAVVFLALFYSLILGLIAGGGVLHWGGA